MKLTVKGIENRREWEEAGFVLPGYDVKKVTEETIKAPVWVHFGIGNIFRVFLGGICDTLLEKGAADKGIVCVEAFDFEVVKKIYDPFDNLSLSIILNGDGTRYRKVIGALSEAVMAKKEEKDWERLKEIFRAPSLQMVSFTVTEKGYALQKADGSFLPYAKNDIEQGPAQATGAMAVVTAMLMERFNAGGTPIALVSMDNCSKNGEKFRESILTMTKEWESRGFVTKEFTEWVSDETKVTFPWTMIDKITPRPSETIAADLAAAGVEDMQPILTDKRTYIAPFVNAEGPQYLVVEDSFPNGRPRLEEAGVYMADRDTVNKAERMKVTACLNPIHTALGPYGVLLGYDLFPDEMRDEDMLKLANRVGYVEGMDVVPDPGILSPKAFLDECMYERFPNVYLGDTCLRLCTDSSQGMGVRFGVTTGAYVEKYGDAKKLIGIPLAVAGWLRYLLAVDDKGNSYELAPDPMAEEVRVRLENVKIGDPDSVGDSLKWILSNENIFFIDFYQAGIGERIEEIFREEIAGKGAVRATVKKWLA